MSTLGSTVVTRGADTAERARPALKGTRLIALLSTTDHKVIGNLYFVTTLAFFCFGGILALLMRAELAFPGLQYFHYERFNQLFTMHGTVMLLFFPTPLFVGFSNAIMPLQIGAPDMAFPRLNAFAYWLYLAGALIACSGFLTPDGAASFGWFAYAPLNSAIHSPGVGADLWIIGLYLSGLGTILASLTIVTTIITPAGPRYDAVATADLLLEHPAHLDHGARRLPGARRRPARAAQRPGARDPHLRRRDGRCARVAAPVLVLRASRGLHHRAAVLRHRERGHPGLLPQADLRLRRARDRHLGHHHPLHDRLGPPHVRHRRGEPAVLLVHVVPDRGAHRREVLQLDRHDVERFRAPGHPDAVVGRFPHHVPVRWPDRRHPRLPAAGLPRHRHLLRGRPLP